MIKYNIGNQEISYEEFEDYKKDLSNFLPFDDIITLVNDTKNMLDMLTDNIYSTVIMNTNYRIFHLGAENLFSSIKTLDNILFCCKNGSFSDANVLLRKYRDDMFQYLYFLKIINESGKYTLALDKMPNKLKERIEAAYLWNKDEFIKNPNHKLKTHIRAVEYIDFLQSDKEIRRCCDKFFVTTWKNIDINSNNYTHANSLNHIRDNFLKMPQMNRMQQCLNSVFENVRLVSIYFLSLLLLLDSHLIMSSDYIDCLELNLEPPEDSQYWIANVFQEYFDKHIYELSPELVKYLRDNNSHCMRIN